MRAQELFDHSDWEQDVSYTEQDMQDIEKAAQVITVKAKSMGINLKFSRHFYDQIRLKRGEGKIDYQMLMNAAAKLISRGLKFLDNKPEMTSYAFQDMRSNLFLEVLKSTDGSYLIRTVIRSAKWMGRSEKIVLEDSRMHSNIRTELEQKGYQFLGKGIDQMAFLEHSTGQVLKIFGADEAGNSKGHDMFTYWANYCKQYDDNPFLPRFSAWKPFEYEGERYLQIRMERLTALPKFWGDALEILAMEAGDHQPLDQVIDRVLDKAKDVDPEKFDDGSIDMYIEQLIVHVGEEGLRLLYKTLVDLTDIGDMNGWNVDLHQGNFMLRNDSTPVIVDPWAVLSI